MRARRGTALLLLVLASLGAAVALARSSDGGGGGRGPSDARLPESPLTRLLPGACRPRPATRAAREGLLLGEHANLHALVRRAPSCAQAQVARDSGVGALREDLSWAESEPRPGVFRWRRFDAVMTAASIKGLRVLVVLDSSPRWAAATPTTLPTDPSAYAGFVAAAVARYGPGGSYWLAHPAVSSLALGWFELWNEPYLKDFAAAGPNPQTYAQLARAAVQSGHSANPRAHFLLEAETTYTRSDGSTRQWVDDMYSAVPDLNRYFDAVAVHPYSHSPPTTFTPGDSRGQSRRIEQVHASFVAHGATASPLWVTEIGWPTCRGSNCVSERQQASYLRSFLTLARGAWRAYVRAVFVYGLNDSRPVGSNREASFGVLRADLSRKPAWAVLRAGG